jgi:catechol 2,3-dioxygenase-like lactoylglutathione lyase family enzyme
VKISGLDHIAHRVDDIPEAIAWYESNLAAKTIYQDPTWAMLDVAGAKIALSKLEHPNHVAFTVESIEELPKTKHTGIHRDGSHYSYSRDHYGNLIEFIYWPKSV